MFLETDEFELAKRIGVALLAVANVPIQDERKAAGSLIAAGIGALFELGCSEMEIGQICDRALAAYPGVSAGIRRQFMRVVETGEP